MHSKTNWLSLSKCTH